MKVTSKVVADAALRCSILDCRYFADAVVGKGIIP